MLLHLRLNVPTALADPVRGLLSEHASVTNLSSHEGDSLVPVGDVVECDVAREAADEVLALLHDTGLPATGGILLSTPTATPFEAARRLEEAAPGAPDDAIIWDTVLEEAESSGRSTATFHVFLVLATLLAAIAVVTDSVVLVVGAMVVGPEFGTVAAISAGLVLGRPSLSGRALRLLLAGFTVAVLAVAAIALTAELTGLVSSADLGRPRPQTGFIWHPDRWSFIVALVAGAAGVLALSTEKASAMVGAFISVTTVPAAGNLAVALGTWTPSEMRGSLSQLGLNLAGMVAAGVVVLAVHRALDARVRPYLPVPGRRR